MKAWEAAKNALECVLGAKEGETIVIFCDHEQIEIGEAFAIGALRLGMQARLVNLKAGAKTYRTGVPQELMDILTKHPPDVYVNLLRGVREETPFRIQLIKLETKDHKSRLGHCPGVTIDMLIEGAMALAAEGHKKMQTFAHALIKKLASTEKLEVTTPAGTKLTLSAKTRPFFTDTIIDWETLKWMNLPTGEVILAPVENSLQGTLVCDMAIGGIGPLKTPVTLTVNKGKVQDSKCEDKQVLKRVRDSLNTDETSSTVGEFAFGINAKARFVEEFLEAEKVLGTTHIAFGNNSDMPSGKNPSKNHMDLLMSKPTVKATTKDGTVFKVLADGVFQKF